MKLLESFKKSTHMIYGGGIGLACALLEGGSAKCVHMRAEGGGGQKRPKNCVRTIWTAPYLLHYLVFSNQNQKSRLTRRDLRTVQ